MRRAIATLFFAAVLITASSASAEMRLTIANGRVTLSAKDVTLGQILAEWGRVGQTRVVNGDRMSAGLMTIELTDMPEADALDILLRTAGGYLLAPRPAPTPAASIYDRIVIFAVTSMPRSAIPPPPAAAATALPPPTFPQPRLGAPRLPEAPGDANEPAAAEPPAPPAAGRGQIFTAFTPANETAPPVAAPPTGFGTFGTITAPAGTRYPGMTVPAQTTPGQQTPNNATTPR